MPQYGWLCTCGHYEESRYHCSICGTEPPWGCECPQCTDRALDEWYGMNDPDTDGMVWAK